MQFKGKYLLKLYLNMYLSFTSNIVFKSNFITWFVDATKENPLALGTILEDEDVDAQPQGKSQGNVGLLCLLSW